MEAVNELLSEGWTAGVRIARVRGWEPGGEGHYPARARLLFWVSCLILLAASGGWPTRRRALCGWARGPLLINHDVMLTNTFHFRQGLAALLLVVLTTACGGGGTFGVFESGTTISLDAFADVEIVELVPVRVESVTVLPDLLTVARGGVAIFSARALDSEGRLLSGLEFEWRIRNQLAGTMSSNGVFTAGNLPGSYSGAVEVIAIQEIDGREFTAVGSAAVIVTSGAIDTRITAVAVFPSTAVGAPGDFVPLRAAAFGDFGGLVQDLDLFWRVTNPDVGEIDRHGNLILGEKPGLYVDMVEVQARRLSGSSPPVVGTASVQVLSPVEAARSVRAIVGPSAVIGRADDRVPLVLLAFDSNGRPVRLASVEWEVVDAAVGTVDRNGVFTVGQVEGHYPGSVMGTGLMDGDLAGESITAVLDVVIQPPSAEPRAIAGEAQILPRGIRMSGSQGIRLSALMFNDRGMPVTAVDPIWDYDPVLFSISSRGRMTALAPPGVYPDAVSTTVTGPDGLPQTVSASVTVLGPMVRVDVTPGRATLAAADAVLFVAQAFDVANNRLFDVRFRWRLEEDAPGTMTSGGLYVAEDEPGLHVGAVKVTAGQRVED
jgi:hypothetical protein